MKPYQYNEQLKCLEIAPTQLAKGLTHAKSIKASSIRIIRPDYTSGPKVDLDLAPFEGQGFIKALTIDGFTLGRVSSVEALYSMKGLRELQTQHAFDLDLARLPQLTNLYFKYTPKFRNLGALVNLTDFASIATKTEDCSFLSGFKKLEFLTLVGNMMTLEGIEGLHAVKRLDVIGSPNLVDAAACAQMKGLRRVRFEKCKRLTDYSFLAKNPFIDDLFIDVLDSLDFVPSMTGLKEIFFWSCKSGDMTPLLASKSLQRVLFTPNKKHYSHTQEAIVEARKKLG